MLKVLHGTITSMIPMSGTIHIIMYKSVRNKAVFLVFGTFVCLQQRETHLYWSGPDRLWESAACDVLKAESEEKTRGPICIREIMFTLGV